MSQSWKITLPLPRADAEALALSIEDGALDDAPVVVASEPDETRPDDWQLDLYFEGEPSAEALAFIAAQLRGVALPAAEPLPDEDWVSLSQSGLDPIHAGRFFVHTPAHADQVPAGAVAIEIEAGRAFGTGRHETTTGCLRAIDALEAEPANIIDVGTGTGLLAIAAARRWPEAVVMATDIDPVAIDVAADNLAANGSPPIALAVAVGVESDEIRARAPFDLTIANILAQPLIEMAGSLVGTTKPGGIIMLAGLLETQKAAVLAAYVSLGCRVDTEHLVGEWPTLVLVTGARRGTAEPQG